MRYIIVMKRKRSGYVSLHSVVPKEHIKYLDNQIENHRWASYNAAVRNLIEADRERQKQE